MGMPATAAHYVTSLAQEISFMRNMRPRPSARLSGRLEHNIACSVTVL